MKIFLRISKKKKNSPLTFFRKIKTKQHDFYQKTTSQLDYYFNSLSQSNPIPNRAYS